jgi:hypothetical protein
MNLPGIVRSFESTYTALRFRRHLRDRRTK